MGPYNIKLSTETNHILKVSQSLNRVISTSSLLNMQHIYFVGYLYMHIEAYILYVCLYLHVNLCVFVGIISNQNSKMPYHSDTLP